MPPVSSVERVSWLFARKATNSELKVLSDEILLKIKNDFACDVDSFLGSLLEKGCLSRCFQVDWCVPKSIIGDYIPLR